MRRLGDLLATAIIRKIEKEAQEKPKKTNPTHHGTRQTNETV